MKCRVGSFGTHVTGVGEGGPDDLGKPRAVRRHGAADGLVGVVELGGDFDERAAAEPRRLQLGGDVIADRAQPRPRVLHREGDAIRSSMTS